MSNLGNHHGQSKFQLYSYVFHFTRDLINSYEQIANNKV